MGIRLAKTAGFCFGVRNAIDLAVKAAKEAEKAPVYTLGHLIHNQEVIRTLEDKGIFAVDSPDMVPENSLVILRAHGVGKDVEDALLQKKVRLIDATCPFVKKIHRIVEDAGRRGQKVIILGDPSHPEVIGIRGWCAEKPYVYLSEEDVLKDPPEASGTYTVVEQTTSDPKVVQGILRLLEARGLSVEVSSTICSATKEHQDEATALARETDIMFVVGSPHSSNSRKLFALCRKENPRTYFVNTAQDVVSEMLFPENGGEEAARREWNIGVTAGASTPQDVIEGVIAVIEDMMKA